LTTALSGAFQVIYPLWVITAPMRDFVAPCPLLIRWLTKKPPHRMTAWQPSGITGPCAEIKGRIAGLDTLPILGCDHFQSPSNCRHANGRRAFVLASRTFICAHVTGQVLCLQPIDAPSSPKDARRVTNAYRSASSRPTLTAARQRMLKGT